MFDLKDVVSFFKKNFNKRDIILITVLITVYLITRLIALDKFPIFSDEGIYIQWAKVAWHDASWRFISLTDGKQPLQTWGTIPFLKLFPDNALLAGRLFAVTTGLIALSGIFTTLYYLLGKKAAFLGSVFYIFTPYFLFYDRMGLVDSGVNASFIWILFFSLILARKRRLDIALIFGLLGGFGLLTKSSVEIFIGLAGLGPILFFEKHIKKFFGNLINFIFLYVIVAILAIVIYNIQRLSPFLHYVSEKNNTFVMTFAEFLHNPLAVFPDNIRLVPTYVLWEMGFFLGILGIAGLIVLFQQNKKLFYYFLLWILAPYTIVAFLSKILFPRYIIFFASLLLILSVYFFSKLKNKSLYVFFIAGFILSVIYFDYTIIFDAKNIPFPPIDRGQYIEGWTAGWGTKEIIEYARQKSTEKPVIILAEGNFGLAADVLNAHLKRNDRITIRGYWPLGMEQLVANQKELKGSYVYVVLSHQLEIPKDWPVKLIQRYDKPNNRSVIFLLSLTK